MAGGRKRPSRNGGGGDAGEVEAPPGKRPAASSSSSSLGWISSASSSASSSVPPELLELLGVRVRRPIPPAFHHLVRAAGTLSTSLAAGIDGTGIGGVGMAGSGGKGGGGKGGGSRRGTAATSATSATSAMVVLAEGTVVAVKAEADGGGAVHGEPGGGGHCGGGHRGGEEGGRGRFRNASRVPALCRVIFDAPPCGGAAAAPAYVEDLTVPEAVAALQAGTKRLGSSYPADVLRSYARMEGMTQRALGTLRDEAMEGLVRGTDAAGREVVLPSSTTTPTPTTTPTTTTTPTPTTTLTTTTTTTTGPPPPQPGLLARLLLVAASELLAERRLRAEHDALSARLGRAVRERERRRRRAASRKGGGGGGGGGDACGGGGDLPGTPRYYASHPTSYLGGSYVPPEEAAARAALAGAAAAGAATGAGGGGGGGGAAAITVPAGGAEDGGGTTAAAAAAAAAAATAEQGFQPAALAQRARAGCALAWEYVVQVDPEAARAAAGAGAGGGAVGPSRRSGRQRGAAGGGGGGDEDGDWDGLPRPPSGQEQGGRVALQLLGELGYLPGHGGEGDEEDAMEEEDDADEEEDEEEEEEDEEEEDDDDDDEEEHSATIDPAFLPTPAEIVHHLGRLQRSVQPRDVQDAIVRAVTLGMETPEFVLEHGREVRRQRRLAGMADRRRKRKKGRGGGSGGASDPMDDGEDETWMVLSVTTGDRLSDLPLFEPSSFARCRFAPKTYTPEDEDGADADGGTDGGTDGGGTVRRSPEEIAAEEAARLEEELEEAEALSQERAEEAERLAKRRDAERRWRQRKTFEVWRHRGINGGCTVWPSWDAALREELASRGIGAEAEPQGPDQDQQARAEGDGGGTGGAADAAAEEPSALVASDAALAQSLAAPADAVPASRRSRRAVTQQVTSYAAESTTLSPAVLLERVDRMIAKTASAKASGGYLSLMDFRSLVLETTSSTYDYQTARMVRRLRQAVGKLVYRLGKASRVMVNLEGDSLCWLSLEAGGIVSLNIPRPLAGAADANGAVGAIDVDINGDKAAIVPQAKIVASTVGDEEVEELQSYLARCHFVELCLRKLVLSSTKGRGSVLLPDIRTVAIAADERPDELEAFDAKECESINDSEWHSIGNPLLGELIYRPAVSSAPPPLPDAVPSAANVNEGLNWFKITSFTPSVPLDEPTETSEEDEDGGKIVKRRLRFRATIADARETMNNEPIILTEAQVRAGIEAGKLAKTIEKESRDRVSNRHPLAGKSGTIVVLRDVALIPPTPVAVPRPAPSASTMPPKPVPAAPAPVPALAVSTMPPKPVPVAPAPVPTPVVSMMPPKPVPAVSAPVPTPVVSHDAPEAGPGGACSCACARGVHDAPEAGPGGACSCACARGVHDVPEPGPGGACSCACARGVYDAPEAGSGGACSCAHSSGVHDVPEAGPGSARHCACSRGVYDAPEAGPGGACPCAHSSGVHDVPEAGPGSARHCACSRGVYDAPEAGSGGACSCAHSSGVHDAPDADPGSARHCACFYDFWRKHVRTYEDDGAYYNSSSSSYHEHCEHRQ